MNAVDHAERYRNYLRSFGIAEPGDRVTELRALMLMNVSFFAYASDEGLRLKAAVTLNGIVRPGGQTDDDWYGFLSAATDAMTASERIAWLETDSTNLPHGLPRTPVFVLDLNHRPALGIDPAVWSLVTAPKLSRGEEGNLTLIAWFLLSGARVPERWTVTASSNAAATIERVSAFNLIASKFDNADAAASDVHSRANKLLSSGAGDDLLWAVQHFVESGGPADFPSLAKLLENPNVAENVKILAVAAVAHSGNPAAVTTLGVALHTDPHASVRRACAAALGVIEATEAVQALASAAAKEPEVTVRAEIINALAAHGDIARDALVVIARYDTDDDLRALAQRKLRV